MKKVIFLILFTLTGFLSCYDGVLDTYDDSVEYKLRDRGPAGGWIFYINPNYKEDGWRYLEAAPVDQNGGASMNWSNIQSTQVGVAAQGVAIGTGKGNTAAIIAQSGHTSSAAKICREYRGGGYSDWFLPSKDELEIMCWNLRGKRNPHLNPLWVTNDNPDVPNVAGGGVGGLLYTLAGSGYWSSSEISSGYSWYQQFDNGWLEDNAPKNSTVWVRAIRAF